MAKPTDPSHPPGLESWTERLREADFTVQAQGAGRFRTSKHGCAAVLEASPTGELQFAVRPGLLVRAAPVRERANDPRPQQDTDERIAHLVDRGFQKFWQAGERQLPALSAQLQALHQFEGDLGALMGLTALYNEALGTVSSRYLYDRLEGREQSKRHRPF